MFFFLSVIKMFVICRSVSSTGTSVRADGDRVWATASTSPTSSSHCVDALQMQINAMNASTLLVTWKPLEDKTVLGYKLYYQCEGGPIRGPAIHVRNASSQLLHNLQPRRVYTIMLQAFAKSGDGNLSIKYASTTEGVRDQFDISEIDGVGRNVNPRPPRDVRITVLSATNLRLSWEAPTTSGEGDDDENNDENQIIRYTVRFSAIIPSRPNAPNVTMFQFRQTDKTHLLLTDLSPHTPYEFSVKSHNRLRSGVYGPRVRQVMPEDLPSCPVAVIWKSNGLDGGRVEWQPPRFRNGVLKEYIVLFKMDSFDGSRHVWQEVEVPSRQLWAELRDLMPQSNYEIKVTARNGAGRCVPTNSISISTPGWKNGKIVNKDNNIVVNATCINCLESPASVGVDANIKATATRSSHGPARGDRSMLGLAIGIMIGLVCFVLCLLALALRHQCMRSTAGQNMQLKHHLHHHHHRHSADYAIRPFQRPAVGFVKSNFAGSVRGSGSCRDRLAICKSDQNYLDEVAWMYIGKEPRCVCYETAAAQFYGPLLDPHMKANYEVHEFDSNSSDSGFRCAMASRGNDGQNIVDQLGDAQGSASNVQNRVRLSPLCSECRSSEAESDTSSSGQDSRIGSCQSKRQQQQQQQQQQQTSNGTRDLCNKIGNTSSPTPTTSKPLDETSTLAQNSPAFQQQQPHSTRKFCQCFLSSTLSQPENSSGNHDARTRSLGHSV